MEGLSVDEFLNHTTGGGGGSVLSWHDKGEVTLFLHPKMNIIPLWSHSWFEVAEVEDKETKEKAKKVFRRRWNCHEREAICKKSRYRDKETNERELPPEVCPMDRMIEAVIKLVDEKKIKWTDPVFRFEGDDPDSEYNITLHAGGIYGAFGRKDLTKEQVGQLRKAHLRRDETWREDLRVKASYLFGVIADPADGCIVAIEPNLLGDKMKAEIRRTLKRKGREDGDPTKHPYPFQWTYDDAQQDFNKKYDVTALEDPPSAEVVKLMREPPPKLDKYTTLGDCLELYESMREHCVLPEGLLDFDEIFAPAKKAGLMEPKKEAAFNEDLEDGDGDPDDGDDTPASDVGDAPDLFECDHCGEPTLSDQETKCPKCGAEYDENNTLCARPCNECKAIIQLDGGPKFICPKCATIHEVQPVKDSQTDEIVETWVTVQKGGAVEKPAAPETRRRRGAPADTKPATPAAKSDDKPKGASIPWSND